jgi:hypothetical protein
MGKDTASYIINFTNTFLNITLICNTIIELLKIRSEICYNQDNLIISNTTSYNM